MYFEKDTGSFNNENRRGSVLFFVCECFLVKISVAFNIKSY